MMLPSPLMATLIGLPILIATALPAQEFRFPDENLVEAAEEHGRAFPRPVEIPAPPHYYPAELEGTAERRCVEVPLETSIVRSGEMIIGGHFSALRVDRPNKIWWKPLNSSLEMTLQVLGVSMVSPGEAIQFEIGPATARYANTRPLRRLPETAFFPGGARFSSPGQWIAVGTSGSNWGCFIFNVPETPADAEGDVDPSAAH